MGDFEVLQEEIAIIYSGQVEKYKVQGWLFVGSDPELVDDVEKGQEYQIIQSSWELSADLCFWTITE